MVEIDDDFDYSTGFDNNSGSDNSGVECAKQARKFPSLTKSNLDQWTSVKLKDNRAFTDATGMKYFEFQKFDTQDYEEIEPFYDLIEPIRVKQILKEHKINKTSDQRMKPWESCQYCGHGMRYIFKIKNIQKKMVMVIGSTCVKYFSNVDSGSALVKATNHLTLSHGLTRWKGPTMIAIKRNHNFYGKYKLKIKYSNFIEKLQRSDPNLLTYSDLKKIFRKAQDLGLNIPYDVKDIFENEKKNKKSGLDDFFGVNIFNLF